MWFYVITVGVLGGLLGLDRRAALQVMVSNPLVASALVGIWIGDPGMGLRVGFVTALLWIHELPVGAVIPPNDTLVAVATTVLAGQLVIRGLSPEAAVMMALLWSIPFGVLAQRIDASARRVNIAVSRWVIQGASAAQGRMLVRAQGVGLLTVFAGDTVCTWLALGSGVLMLPFIAARLSAPVLTGLGLVFYLLPLVGVAAGIATINRRRAWWIVAAIFVAYNALLELWGR
jgi:PTS system mannose-specific IIC component